MPKLAEDVRHTATMVLTAMWLAGCGGDGDTTGAVGEQPYAVPRVTECASGDRPEAGLQGQVPAALRANGFGGFNCNLRLVSALPGEGASWSSAAFRDSAGRRCAYHSTGSTVPTPWLADAPALPDRAAPGVPVIDISDASKPVRTGSLTTRAMLDPWESLRVHAGRQILMSSNGSNGGTDTQSDSTIDIYDLSADCRYPQLLASTEMNIGGALPQDAKGHEGAIASDGLTYWVGDSVHRRYYAIDITNTTRPRALVSFDLDALGLPGARAHGLSISPDGNRAYVIMGSRAGDRPPPADAAPGNGFAILDISEVQQRRPSPRVLLVSKAFWTDGSTGQTTIQMRIQGVEHLVAVDEVGSLSSVDASCKAGLSPFPMARIYDISDETNPRLVRKLPLETHDPANCEQIKPDLVSAEASFSYGSHYCSVDNRHAATALACSYFNSGIRVFDIRDPANAREIAYLNPAAGRRLPGSERVKWGVWREGHPDWCAAQIHFDHHRRQLVTACMDNGLLTAEFAPGVWPFAESVASTDQN